MNKNTDTALVFVYNAKSDWINKATDFAHKLISPQTYACELCSLTHGVFTAHSEWVVFLKNLPIPSKFYYKNDSSLAKYNLDELSSPFVAIEQNEELEILLLQKDLAQLNTIEELIGRLENIIKQKSLSH